MGDVECDEGECTREAVEADGEEDVGKRHDEPDQLHDRRSDCDDESETRGAGGQGDEHGLRHRPRQAHERHPRKKCDGFGVGRAVQQLDDGAAEQPEAAKDRDARREREEQGEVESLSRARAIPPLARTNLGSRYNDRIEGTISMVFTSTAPAAYAPESWAEAPPRGRGRHRRSSSTRRSR